MQASSSFRSPVESQHDYRFVMGLTGLVLVGLALRLVPSGQSLWLDELHTSWVTSGRWSDVAPRAAQGNQGPLYFWIVWLVTRLAPDHELVLRSVSLLAGAGTILSAGWLARRWTASRTLGCVAAGITVGDPHAVYFSAEARPYALITLLAIWHIEVFRCRLSLFRSPNSWRSTSLRITWIVLTWALFYTHFTSLILVPAEFAYVSCTAQRRRLNGKTAANRWLIDTAWVAGGCALAGPQLLAIGRHRDDWSQFVRPQGISSLWTMFSSDLYIAAPILLALFVALTTLCRGARTRLNTRRLRYFMPLLICWYLVPIGIAWSATGLNLAPLWFRRYVWISAPALWINGPLWGTLLTGRRFARSIFVGLIAVLTIATAVARPQQTWTVHSNEDWRSAVALIQSHVATRDWPVVLRSGLIEDHHLRPDSSERFRRYCSFAVRGIYSLEERPGPIVPVRSDRPKQVTDRLRRLFLTSPGVWLIYRGPVEAASAVPAAWHDQLIADGKSVTVRQVWSFGNVTVISIRLESKPATLKMRSLRPS